MLIFGVRTALAKYDIVKPGGSLTLTSGGAAFHPGKGAAIGGALNAGLLTFTKGLAAELAEKKIRVNTVVPGLVKTDLFLKLGKSRDEQQAAFENGAKTLSVGFVGTPEDVAEAYLYTARADYANGSIVVIGMFPPFPQLYSTVGSRPNTERQTEEATSDGCISTARV